MRCPETAAAERLEPGMVLGLSAFVWEAGIGAAYARSRSSSVTMAPNPLQRTRSSPIQPAHIQETP